MTRKLQCLATVLGLLSAWPIVVTAAKNSVVDLLVVDMFGTPLKAAVEVDEIAVQSGRVIGSWTKGTTEASLSEGVHRLRVHVRGFRYELIDVNVSDTPVFRVVSMKLGSMSGEDPRVAVRGRLLNAKQDAQRWVRASPLFAHEISEVKVDDTGQFRFERLDAGKYLFHVMVNDSLVCSTQRDVVGNGFDLTTNLNQCFAPR